jgi:hypothetical protein
MLTPIAGSILSVHAHAIGASHGPLEFDINTFLGALDAIFGNAKNRAKKGSPVRLTLCFSVVRK